MRASAAAHVAGALLLLAVSLGPRETSAEYTLALLSDLHVGEGCPAPYNGTDDCYSVQYLKEAVSYLNTVLVPSAGVAAVLISGDLTSSAFPTHWPKVRGILDTLAVPYLVAIGNHDIWPYDRENGTWMTPFPNGDVYFAETFADVFGGLMGEGPFLRVTNYTNRTSTWNAAHNCTSTFQSWEAVFTDPDTGDVALFLAPDFNTRDKAWDPTERGVMGYAERGLSDFPGGTLQWLDERLAAAAAASSPRVGRIYLLHHQPYACPFYVPDALFCFGVADKVLLQGVLEKHFPPETFWGAFTGHTHLFQGPAAPFADWSPTFVQFETSAVKGDGLFPNNITASITTVVFGAGANVTAITEHWHDPTTGAWGSRAAMEGGVWSAPVRRPGDDEALMPRKLSEEERERLVRGFC